MRSCMYVLPRVPELQESEGSNRSAIACRLTATSMIVDSCVQYNKYALEESLAAAAVHMHGPRLVLMSTRFIMYDLFTPGMRVYRARQARLALRGSQGRVLLHLTVLSSSARVVLGVPRVVLRAPQLDDAHRKKGRMTRICQDVDI